MKAAQFKSQGANLEIVQVPIPTPGDHQVRIKVHYTGICHGDNVAKYGGMGNTWPRIPGHEIAGVIDEVGKDVKSFQKGERVGAGWYGGNCGECRNCERNLRIACPKSPAVGTHHDGGYAEYVVVNASAVARIPDNLELEQACSIMCAGLTCFRALKNSGVLGGEIVVVHAIGGLGHFGIQYARKLGYYTVAVSSGSEKEALALKLGAHKYIDSSKQDVVKEIQALGGAKIVLETAPHAKAIEDMIPCLDVGGKILIAGASHEPFSVNPLSLISKNSGLQGVVSGDSRDAEDVLKFSANFDVRGMIEVFPLEKAQEAFDLMMSSKVKFRSVLKIVQ